MRILKQECCLVVIDVQERLYPHMYDSQSVLNNMLKLIEGTKVLEIPIILTQQYTRGLGDTISDIRSAIGTSSHIEKMSFSCCDEETFNNELSVLGSKKAIVCGIESHICVLQTALDLMDKNIIPIVVADCVSSRREYDKEIALKRIQAIGGIVTTYESILLELTRFAGTPKFKSISQLIKS